MKGVFFLNIQNFSSEIKIITFYQTLTRYFAISELLHQAQFHNSTMSQQCLNAAQHNI